MEYYICLILLSAVSFGEKNAARSENIEEGISRHNFVALWKSFHKYYPDQFEYNVGKNGDLKFELDAGNPDINARIERPCEIYDTFCIRHFFAEHSKCRISAELVPEPLFRAQSTFNLPSTNVSSIFDQLEYTGLRTGKVEEFYINKETDNLVITIGFDFISFNGSAFLKFYRRGREPAYTSDFADARFERMSITVIIPHLKDLRLEKADISTFLYAPTYLFRVGPGIIPTDPEQQSTYLRFAESLTANQQEAFITEGNFVAATFLQYNICDFGLKVL